MYANGNGVARDTSHTTEAIRWYERAAAKGYELAIHNLADLRNLP